MKRHLPFFATLVSGLAALATGLQHPATSSRGEVLLHTDPSSAEVWLDGKSLGQSPIRLELAPRSNHRLELRKDGYQILQQTVRLEDGSDLSLRMLPRWATLKIADASSFKVSLGPGATTQLEGKGPWKLLPGNYELMARKDGLPSKIKRFTVKAGETLEIEPEWPEFAVSPPSPPAQPQATPPAAASRPSAPQARPQPNYQAPPAYQPPAAVYRPPAPRYQAPRPQPIRQPAPLWTPIPVAPAPAPAPAPSFPPSEHLFTPLP